jgi:IclR family transcriptional regulator, acetate operon repressor
VGEPDARESGKLSNVTGTQAVDRACRLLMEVLDAPAAPSHTELMVATGLPKSTTSRLLLALERNSLVSRDPAERFHPGEAFLRFSWRGGGPAELASIAAPYLERLGDETGETVNLGITRRGVVEQIAQVDGRYLLGATNWVGRPVPLHSTALGKVLLAFGVVKVPAGRLQRCTPMTITSRAALEAELALVRRRGYALTDGELEPGLVAVSAPIHNNAGTTLAAVSVSGPATRLSGTPLRRAVAACVEQSVALSRALGYRREISGQQPGKANRGRPDNERPDSERPDSERPDSERPDSERPDSERMVRHDRRRAAS